jgi:ribonucleoside-diphosphate reductase alpha chain|tara:strand:- start:6103 stop:8412 length:2310 start_codon:yes stop_codon:yes gene_type:complete
MTDGNTMRMHVVKRDGTAQDFNLEKIHKVLEWATEGISGVSISEIELKANIQLYDKIPAYDIHELLIKSAAELISENTPNYQGVAARLISYKLRKEVYGDFTPKPLVEIVIDNVDRGVYDGAIMTLYTREELEELSAYIKHERDDTFTYAGMEQFRGKYLVQDRRTKQHYETPQVLYMMISATLFSNYPQETRLKYVKDYYDAISQFYISLPTPIMAGVRTPTRQFSSCVLIESGDSLDSINATATSIVKYISKKAGIGIGAGSIRAEGSKVGDGSVVHTGLIPFLKYFQAAVKSCSQGGVRGGAATVYLPVWHYEFEDLIVLKNNKGTEENRVRHMDYAFQLNKLMYERLLSGGNITFFDPNDVPGLYDAFFADQDKFKELYEKYEKTRSVRKKTLSALEVFQQLLQERKDTGRIYVMNVDHANEHGAFVESKAPIRMSNLCCEIDLPTSPLSSNPDEGEISLCTLSAINWGLINDPSEFEKYCDLSVRALDELLDYQSYPVLAAEKGTMNRRPLGIGIINLAYFLAKRGLKYDSEAHEVVDEYAEAWSYYLIKASANLASEKGEIPLKNHTKYASGVLPIDTYKRAVDNLIEHRERMPWNELRNQLKETGTRNSTLMALMPAETSAQISNSTNGIEPPRALVSYKQSKDGVMAQVVPGYHHLKNKYDLLWDQKSPDGYLKICAILQKYIDQGISVNTSYNPEHFEDNKIPMSTMITDLVTAYKFGLKQLYYFNTYDGAGEITDNETHHAYDGEPIVIDEDDCESCKI